MRQRQVNVEIDEDGQLVRYNSSYFRTESGCETHKYSRLALAFSYHKLTVRFSALKWGTGDDRSSAAADEDGIQDAISLLTSQFMRAGQRSPIDISSR